MGMALGACAEGMLMLREAVYGRYDNTQGSIDPRPSSLAPAQLLNLKINKNPGTK